METSGTRTRDYIEDAIAFAVGGYMELPCRAVAIHRETKRMVSPAD